LWSNRRAPGALELGAVGRPDAPPSSPDLSRPAEIRPLSPTRYSLRVTLSADTHAKLRRVQDLLRHTVPDGDPAVILDRALTLLVAHLEQAKFAATKRRLPARRARQTSRSKPRRSRHIPAAVRRAVWKRDGGRCAFVGAGGRCPETGFLEFHHRIPFADGGEATTSNTELRCRSHNAYEATRWSPTDAAPTWAPDPQRLAAADRATRSGPS
jgi:5-methylcytosine-specific restriction endonuclease McrA